MLMSAAVVRQHDSGISSLTGLPFTPSKARSLLLICIVCRTPRQCVQACMLQCFFVNVVCAGCAWYPYDICDIVKWTHLQLISWHRLIDMVTNSLLLLCILVILPNHYCRYYCCNYCRPNMFCKGLFGIGHKSFCLVLFLLCFYFTFRNKWIIK